jgi:hydrogenase/urease accessory protein HupE
VIKMARHYKNEGIMKVLTILGGVVGLLTCILSLAGYNYAFFDPLTTLDRVIKLIIGIVVSIITIWAGLKPRNPIPFHWVMLIILGVLLIVFGAGVWACVLVIIAALIGIVEDL